MKQRGIIFLLMLILIIVITGCSDGNSPQQKDNRKITVLLDWVPNTNHTGLYVAQDKGYYAEEGLNVEIVQPAEGGTAQLIAAGQGDFGISYQEEVTIARSQDIPVVALAAIIQHNTSGFASPVDRNITTPADFENNTYGGWGSPAEIAVLKALMDKYNADLDKVNMLNIGSADFFTSIEKDIDFAWIYYGWTGIEAELRNIDLNFIKLRDEHEALDFYTPVLIASEAKIEADPELVRKFIKATARGYQFAIDNPEEAANILLSKVPELDKDLVLASQEYLAQEYQADTWRWGEMKSEVWEKYTDFMFNNQLIDKKIDISKAFTNKYLPVE